MSIPEGFVPVTLDLIDDYEAFRQRTPRRSADYTFTNLWGWAGYYGLSLGFRDDLVWVHQSAPEPRYWAPVGDWNAADWESHPEIRAGVTFHRAPDELGELLRARLNGRVRTDESREQWEYLYDREELATLSGNKFHKKKNHVNGFRKMYGEDYRPLDNRLNPRGIEDVLALQEEWCRWRDCENSPSLQAENDVIFRVAGNWGRLHHLTGGSLYVEDKMVAFAIGEALDPETLVVHFEKVQPDYRGVYQAINNAFVVHAGQSFSVINREQDMGEEGLRQAKETYNPVGFLKKSRLVIAPEGD